MANVKENTTFMNHVNDMYNYVQLPLKMNESQANGDLYVYARKKGKNAVNEDGKMTALLHLNMDHLGAMDIFLTLSEGNKLNTKFTLEKEEMIDFIASHIDELNARLQKKGYNAGTVVLKKDEPDKTAIENIVGNKENILLSTQSFDARA
jgi:flagellar hook-length control protein FliK